MISLKPQMNTDKYRLSLPEFVQKILRQSRDFLLIPLGFSSKIRGMTNVLLLNGITIKHHEPRMNTNRHE